MLERHIQKQRNKRMFDDYVGSGLKPSASHTIYADAYLRYSTVMQNDGVSIEYQMKEIKEYAKRNGIVIKNWYIDKALSAGKTAGRKEFLRYMETVEEGTSEKMLIVWSTNRLFRNTLENLQTSEFLLENGIQFVSATQNIDLTTPTGKAMHAVTAVFDSMKIAETSEQVKAAQRYMISEKLHAGGKPPLGYKSIEVIFEGKPKKKIVPCEKSKEAIATVFKMVAGGATINSAFFWINEQGFTIARDSVRELLKNKMYVGTKVYNNKGKEPLVVHDYCEPIIDEETFNAVQNILQGNSVASASQRKRKRIYALTGKIICAECGCAYVGHSMGGKNTYYRCNGKHKMMKCSNKVVNRPLLERKVFDTIVEYLLSDKAITSITNKVLDKIKKSPASEIDKTELTKRAKILQKEIAELVQMKLNKDIDGETMLFLKKPKEDELHNIKNKLKEIEIFHSETFDEEAVRKTTQKLFDRSQNFEDCESEALQSLFEQAVEKIEVSSTQVVIYLRLAFDKNMFKTELQSSYHSLNIQVDRNKIKR